jgi:DNA polymerase
VGTQTVFSEGPRSARVVVVGEQPGDMEDRAGQPFVGPAGRLLDHAFDAAGIDRDDVYLTNAVKHFKWARDTRTTRRLHKTPNAGEVRACFPWLENELRLIKPDVLVCLGAIAAKALLGPTFSVTKMRGIAIESSWAPIALATVHPASVLRAPPDARKRAEAAFLADIRKVAKVLASDAVKERRSSAGSRRFGAWPPTIEPPSAHSSGSTRSSRG